MSVVRSVAKRHCKMALRGRERSAFLLIRPRESRRKVFLGKTPVARPEAGAGVPDCRRRRKFPGEANP